MQPLSDLLVQRFQAAVRRVDASLTSIDPLIRPSANPSFGDFQANLAMSLAKQLGRKPREVAEAVVAALDLDDLCDRIEIAGPGFINIHLAAATLARHVQPMADDPRLATPAPDSPDTIVVDYSSPNVAKEMHVGHLRSTVIGDAIARILSFQGHRVIRQNHLGDWGTQFGMLIELLLEQGFDAAAEVDAANLTRLYKQAKQRFDTDAAFTERARRRVVKLQAGDDETVTLWKALVSASVDYFQAVYAKLNVLLQPDDVRGESFYNDRLPGVVERLETEGHLQQSQGAAVVVPEGFTDREGNPLPMIVRKSDGGYLYATTDLAAALFRVQELHATRIVYVIGLPQKQHFDMFTTALRQFGWVPPAVKLDFVGFGSVLGPDRKMFKTRSGETVRLEDLVDEAVRRADAVVSEKNPDLDAATRASVAQAVGIGALKYADLASDRVKDYIFDWDRMLAFEGNTAPYLQYSYVRIRSIFRRGEVDDTTLNTAALQIIEPAERALALLLVQWPDVVRSVADSLEPHRLCNYLYELSSAFHRFFEHCPVLKADDNTRASRLVLCHTTARTLKLGLSLLGINTIEQM